MGRDGIDEAEVEAKPLGGAPADDALPSIAAGLIVVSIVTCTPPGQLRATAGSSTSGGPGSGSGIRSPSGSASGNGEKGPLTQSAALPALKRAAAQSSTSSAWSRRRPSCSRPVRPAPLLP
jgi:hypothetical protein